MSRQSEVPSIRASEARPDLEGKPARRARAQRPLHPRERSSPGFGGEARAQGPRAAKGEAEIGRDAALRGGLDRSEHGPSTGVGRQPKCSPNRLAADRP
jgi:hypothetical protein